LNRTVVPGLAFFPHALACNGKTDSRGVPGIHGSDSHWIPAFAGMTRFGNTPDSRIRGNDKGEREMRARMFPLISSFPKG
jgi:hypothetical protein